MTVTVWTFSSVVSQFSQAVQSEAGVEVNLLLDLVVSVPAAPVGRHRLAIALLAEVLILLLLPGVEPLLAPQCGAQLVEDIWVELVGQLASDLYNLAGAAVVPQRPRHLLIGHGLAVALPLAPTLGQLLLVLGDEVEGAIAAVGPLDRVHHVGVIQGLVEVFIKPELLTT